MSTMILAALAAIALLQLRALSATLIRIETAIARLAWVAADTSSQKTGRSVGDESEQPAETQATHATSFGFTLEDYDRAIQLKFEELKDVAAHTRIISYEGYFDPHDFVHHARIVTADGQTHYIVRRDTLVYYQALIDVMKGSQ